MQLYSRVGSLLNSKDRVIVAIDGKCASGKSTLANKLKEKYNGTVFHMDDYFLPFERKTLDRMSEPGGNVDYERIYEEVFLKLAADIIEFRRFDCRDGVYYKDSRRMNKLIIIEGAYSMRPEFRKFYDLSIFIDIDDKLQIERIKKRNGEHMLSKFINEWIPLENKYFTELNIKEECEIVLGE
ncbi:uridine kinase [Mycoplasmatota bacterium]|nr:uridine kinase [Mycoplasmatota bacterium]